MTRKKPDDIRGEFTVVAVAGTHRDNTKKRYGRHEGTAKAKLSKADRQRILLEARRDGLSWREAGKRAGYRSVGSAYAAGAEAIRDIPREAADEARSLEMQRLDELLRTFLPLARRGDVDAGNLVLRTVDRRARLLGLDLAEPEQPGIDVRLQAMLLELISMSPEEFERHEREQIEGLHADQRSAAGKGRANGTSAAVVELR